MAASSTNRRRYDVFLSFRGCDTRRSFTDHLDAAMKRKGIRVFKDDRGLEVGKDMGQQLLGAIEDSRFAVVVFSENYAGSSWCLDEVAKIHDCMLAAEGLTVLPVFYNIEPSDVRHQKGCFTGAFQAYRDGDVEPERVQRWRTVLDHVANLTGWDLHNRHEAEIVEEIAKHISSKLWLMFSGIASELVGFESRVDSVVEMMGLTSDGVQSIGIVGMGGIGKSTTARIVYERLLHLFDAGSFLADIGRNSKKDRGLVTLQEQLLSETLHEENVRVYNTQSGIQRIRSQLGNLKVLLILDDIDDPGQFVALAGDLNWFGPGSRILITTRNNDLLHNVCCTYEVGILNSDDARNLFRWNAFGREAAIHGDYEPVTEKVVGYCGGLPLALKVLGCFLKGKTIIEWENAMDKLKENPDRRILDILEMSYDGLDRTEKSAFLYIACIFADFREKDCRFRMDCLSLFPHVNIKTLMERSLVSVSEGRLRMHDQLRELGRDLVRRESPTEPAKRSILWSFQDIQNALNRNTGTGSPEALMMNWLVQQPPQGGLSLHGLSKFDKLKLLDINNGYEFSGKLESLSNDMRILAWRGYPGKWLPSNFQPRDLCHLDLSSSNIAKLWDYYKCFDKLRDILLCNSENLVRVPDISNLPNLRALDLEGCIRLVELRSSMPLHERLIYLNLRDCRSLRCLPKQIHFPALETFVLSGCVSLTRLPKISGPMGRLPELHLDSSAILEVPPSIKFLTGLVRLNASNCPLLLTLSSAISELEHLKFLNLDGCVSLIDMPMNLAEMNLEQLQTSRCGIYFHLSHNCREWEEAHAEVRRFLDRGFLTFFYYSTAPTKMLFEFFAWLVPPAIWNPIRMSVRLNRTFDI